MNKRFVLEVAFVTVILGTTLALKVSAQQSADFDKGVAVSPLLKEAQDLSQTIDGADEGSVWVTFQRSDISQMSPADFPLRVPVIQSAHTAVYRVEANLLPRLSDLMHDRFKRCGGFYAHDTLEEAKKDLAAPRAVPAGISYTIDQQAAVKPLLGLVKEAEIRGTIQAMSGYNNRYYVSDTGVAAARWLHGRWQGFAAKLPGASAALYTHKGWKQPSVILTIPGTDKADEIVVLGGHLDSINGWGGEKSRAPGADDNASGIATLTEAVRVLSESGFKPRRTVQFMGYSAEEVGLRGSQEIAKKYAQEGKKVVAVIQFDMTNFKGSPEDMFILTDNVDAGLTAYLGKLIDAYLSVTRSTTKCGYACSDHASWTKAGFPAAMSFESSFEGYNQDIHTEKDTLAASGGSAEHSVNFAKLAVAFAMEIAKTSSGLQLKPAGR